MQTPIPQDSPEIQEGLKVVQALRTTPKEVTAQQVETLERLLKNMPNTEDVEMGTGSEGNKSKPPLDIDAMEQLLLGQAGDNEEEKERLRKMYREAARTYKGEPQIKRPCGGSTRT